MPNEEDPFAGLEPQGNNRPSGGNQGQWSNQRPNQQTGNQNQWGTNGNNQGQNQWGTNGNNQGQNLQWGTNGNNQGQNQWGTNGNNQGQSNQGNRPPTQPNTNQGNRPPTQPNTNQGNRPLTQPTTNQNLVQTSTTSSNSEEASEEQRNACNATCRERITNEYNPVCGSDSQTYQNRRFLDCVANCGISKYCSFVCNSINQTNLSNHNVYYFIILAWDGNYILSIVYLFHRSVVFCGRRVQYTLYINIVLYFRFTSIFFSFWGGDSINS